MKNIITKSAISAFIFLLAGCSATETRLLTVTAVQLAPIKDIPRIRAEAIQVEELAGLVVDECDKRLGNEPVLLLVK